MLGVSLNGDTSKAGYSIKTDRAAWDEITLIRGEAPRALTDRVRDWLVSFRKNRTAFELIIEMINTAIEAFAGLKTFAPGPNLTGPQSQAEIDRLPAEWWNGGMSIGAAMRRAAERGEL